MLEFRKTDLIIPAAGLLAAILIYLIPVFGAPVSDAAGEAVVTVGGEFYASYPLSQDTDVVIPGVKGFNNHLVIRNGEADIIDALCPDKICVHERKISRDGETLVCLPNRVVVEIRSGKEDGFDAVAR